MGQVRILGRVRTRLLAAFLLLLGATVLLAGVGWIGLYRMQGALAGVEEELLPRISRAMELSEHAEQLAGTVPKLGDSLSPAELDAHRRSVEALLAQIGQGSRDLSEPTPQLQHVMDRLQESVNRHLPALIELSQKRQRSQTQLGREVVRLDRLGQALHGPRPEASPGNPRISSLWSTLVMGAAVTNTADIGRLEADAEALLISLRSHKDLASLSLSEAQELVALAEGPDAVLACRHNLINLDAQVDYLVTLTRADAGDLGEETSRYVAQLRVIAADRSERVRHAARTSQNLMLVLTGLCVVIGLGAAPYVRRLVGEIETIAHVMSRLAHGDTAQPTPATARPDELGELARSFEVFRDNLIAKQQLVRDLHAQRELIEAVHDNLTDGLAVFNREGHLMLWNTRLMEMLGRQGVEPRIGSTPAALINAFPPGTTWSGQDRRKRLGLEQLPPDAWVRTENLELRGPDGQVLDLRSCAMPQGGTVTLVTDLSARRAIENQLQQAQKLEVLGQLTGAVAHDFNNYLGTILGNLALLEARVGEDDREHVQWQRVRRAATSAAGLTRRLLAFARRQPLEAEDVLVDEMLEEMLDLIEYSAGDSVTLRLELAAGVQAVHVDRGQLENALLNLVMNSAAAMPQGGLLTVATTCLVQASGDVAGPPRSSIELCVTDTGIGMTEAQASKAFEPFFSTRPVGEGSGLGLSIVYGFVRQSGGEIALHSRPGQGTRVTMRFPAVASEIRHPPSAPEPMTTLDRFPNHVVLLVEDDETYRATLVDQLSQLDVRVHALQSAEAAVDVLASGLVVHGMISDIRLGQGANGIALARTVRARWPSLPILLMSGEVPELASQARSAAMPRADSPTGEPQFLQKPFALAQLLGWLRALPVICI